MVGAVFCIPPTTIGIQSLPEEFAASGSWPWEHGGKGSPVCFPPRGRDAARRSAGWGGGVPRTPAPPFPRPPRALRGGVRWRFGHGREVGESRGGSRPGREAAAR